MFFFFQAEDGIRDCLLSRGLGDVYKRQGQDIVCAAVSALIITTVNSLEKFTEEQIEAEADEGYVSIHFKTNPNTEHGKLLMDSLILGLTEIEHSYNNRYLTVRVKEV